MIAITADPTLDPVCAERTSTLVHEAAHFPADHRGRVDRHDAETVAESTAYGVMDYFGIDAGASSFVYVAAWAKDTEVLRRNLGEIQQLSSRLITAVQGVGDPFAERAEEFIAVDPWQELRRLTPEDLERPEPHAP